MWIILLFLYFAPTLNAMMNGKRNTFAIFLTNLLLGWSGVGWVAALIWSVVRDRWEIEP